MGVLTSLTAAHIVFGQTAEGVITYEVKVNMHRRLPPERAEMKTMIPEFRISKQQLFFKGQESLYKPLIEDEDEETTTSHGGEGGGTRVVMRMPNVEIYLDQNSSVVISKQEFMGKEYLIQDSVKVSPWKFGSESKTIQGYECKQAYYTDESRPDRKQEITAWYTDKIRPFLGPERFNTLPGAVLAVAAALMKIANDVRLYASGPRAGIGELRLPENEPGSSIMPGKINPTQCEALTMVAVQVFGNDHAVAFANSQGQFQLNVYKPVILHNVLESVRLLADACLSFERHCARGIEPDLARIREHVEQSLMLVTALTPHIGYEKSAEIALLAHRERLNLREAAVKSGHVSPEQFDQWVRPEKMARPHADS